MSRYSVRIVEHPDSFFWQRICTRVFSGSMGKQKYCSCTEYWFFVSETPGLVGAFFGVVGTGSTFAVHRYLVLLLYAESAMRIVHNGRKDEALATEELLLPNVNQGEIDSIYTVVGRWDPNIVYMRVPLAPWDERTQSQQEILSKIRPGVAQIPGAPGRAFGSNSLNLRGQGGGICAPV